VIEGASTCASTESCLFRQPLKEDLIQLDELAGLMPRRISKIKACRASRSSPAPGPGSDPPGLSSLFSASAPMVAAEQTALQRGANAAARAFSRWRRDSPATAPLSGAAAGSGGSRPGRRCDAGGRGTGKSVLRPVALHALLPPSRARSGRSCRRLNVDPLRSRLRDGRCAPDHELGDPSGAVPPPCCPRR